eukprot:scaffold7429_cov417-Prasinococcus_capsulatus_cf.AAC.9
MSDRVTTVAEMPGKAHASRANLHHEGAGTPWTCSDAQSVRVAAPSTLLHASDCPRNSCCARCCSGRLLQGDRNVTPLSGRCDPEGVLPLAPTRVPANFNLNLT